jgi:uncharacterized protein YcnI
MRNRALSKNPRRTPVAENCFKRPQELQADDATKKIRLKLTKSLLQNKPNPICDAPLEKE